MLLEKIPIKLASSLVIGYMVLAFGWWSWHLWSQNDRLFESEKATLEARFSHAGQGVNLTRMYDTTEYKRAEKNWKKSQRMIVSEGLFFVACLIFGLWIVHRSANREVKLARQRRNFLLSITHELKSPIAALRLELETLRKHNLPPEHREQLLSNGLKDVSRLQNLVEDLLLAARLEDNWRPLPEPINLPALVQEIVTRLRVRFTQADIRVHFPDHFPIIQADQPGLSSVIQNLLENALKYSPPGAPVECTVAMNNGKVSIRIADQGFGIPAEEKEAVFEKFYRLGSEETRQSTGTGLGLYIVQQIVKAHGGTISVVDNKPKGTVFLIEF
ncbi:MAG TPA: ATP-binding protein [Saprospiraceae bacterium]|nr:ATP-binding protein [Saprospiraceae bacterium]HPI08231.1 ATP-binding protein [Saprospiraceae bacterium]